MQTLKNKNVKSILIELNEKIADDIQLISTIKECGFKLKEIKQGPAMAKDPNFTHMHNYIFER